VTAEAKSQQDDPRPLHWALLAVGVVTLVRVAAVFATPLELYPDEAQYWLWAQAPDWGYASKPPMVAWLIALSTGIGGDGEAWVRLPAPLLHAATALALFAAGRRLYDARAGLLACILWLLTPAVALSSAFIATDAPFLLCLALSLWAYAALLQAPDVRARLVRAALLGAAVGAALLSKQAALYALIGLVLHALLSREARGAWSGWAWAAALAAFAVLVAPNLVWQAHHGFVTVAHTAQVNAGVGAAQPFRPLGGLEFFAAQFGVFGPIPFAVLIGGGALAVVRRRAQPADLMLLCFALPPLVAMVLFAVFREAEANWGAAAFPAATVLVSAWLIRWRARGWIATALAIQGAAAVLIATALFAPSLADAVGQGAALKRMRGWRATAAFAAAQARAQAPLSAVAVEDRSLFNELAYYGCDLFAAPGAPRLRIRPPQGRALNHAELTAPLTAAEGGRALVLAQGEDPPLLSQEFVEARPVGRAVVPLDQKRVRPLQAWLGLGYAGPVSSRRP
jgi:4-amino-4-deoxy-L-arabinose transferase-like glycosyltransferase